MGRLTQRDFHAILQFLSLLYVPTGLGDFRDHLVDNLRSLIPCDIATYDEMNPHRHTSIDRASPSGIFTPEVSRQCWRPVMHEHPVLMYYQRTGDLAAYTISDFYSESQFHRLALYYEHYRKISIEDALCKGLWASGPVVIGCALHRARRSFTTRDRLMLDLIGPHLTQAWQNAREVSRLRQQTRAMGRPLEALDCAVITLSPAGRVRVMTPRARSLLKEFYGAAGDHHLPEVLARWFAIVKMQFAANQLPRPLAPLVVERGKARLVVRMLVSPPQDLLLLEAEPLPAARVQPERLGLTRREAEVLAWVAQGKTNPEIATILGASPRTVQKHLEHIFVKLGVETRTAAAALALQAASAATAG